MQIGMTLPVMEPDVSAQLLEDWSPVNHPGPIT